MEVERLILALEETVSLLERSEDSAWSSIAPEEIIRRLQAEIAKAKKLKPLDVNFLDHLFAPTGSIQEVSVRNNWGTKFLCISEIVDQFTGSKE